MFVYYVIIVYIFVLRYLFICFDFCVNMCIQSVILIPGLNASKITKYSYVTLQVSSLIYKAVRTALDEIVNHTNKLV